MAGSLTSLVAVGCSGNVGLPEGPDAEAASSTAAAVVVVSRTAGPGETLRDDAIVARFLRVRQGAPLDEAALRIAGVAQDLPPLGQCSSTGEERAARQPREIDLVDVGPLSFEGGTGKSTVLLPRAMPDPTGIVSGVFYSARSPEAFAPASRLQLRAGGGQGLAEGFVVNVASPRDVGDVRAFASGTGLDVQWDAAEEQDARDVVYMDVLDKGARLVTRCTTHDVGHFVVPALDLGTVDEGQVVVHRVHHEGFRAKGIEPGEVRFDLARVAAFKR